MNLPVKDKPANKEAAALPNMLQLISIMARLRDKEQGCPWDLEQNFQSIARYTIEEAYEVVDAIEREDMAELKEELGDLLLQVVFHAQMAQESGLFSFEDVAEAICQKMTKRHPHVFSDTQVASTEDVHSNWEKLKAEERATKSEDPSVLANIPVAFPALIRALKLQKRAAHAGFDWENSAGVIAKIEEELAEVRQADTQEARQEEIGDLLFAVSNLARHYKVNAEDALRGANQKFEHRFRAVESALKARGKTLEDSNLEEMEALWQQAKQSPRP